MQCIIWELWCEKEEKGSTGRKFQIGITEKKDDSSKKECSMQSIGQSTTNGFARRGGQVLHRKHKCQEQLPLVRAKSIVVVIETVGYSITINDQFCSLL